MFWQAHEAVQFCVHRQNSQFREILFFSSYPTQNDQNFTTANRDFKAADILQVCVLFCIVLFCLFCVLLSPRFILCSLFWFCSFFFRLRKHSKTFYLGRFVCVWWSSIQKRSGSMQWCFSWNCDIFPLNPVDSAAVLVCPHIIKVQTHISSPEGFLLSWTQREDTIFLKHAEYYVI